jgi:chemotaxis protein histidine kinase CheA
MNTLDGALKSVGSSWEKLILGMRESDGILSAITNSFAVFLDVLSSDEFKLVDLLNPARLTSVMGAQKAVLDFAKDANREELEDLYTLHVDKARAGEKFSQKIIDLTINRLKALEQQEIDSEKRKRIAAQNVELEKIALSNETEEGQIKKEKEITDNAQREADERIKIWKDETLKRAKLKQEQINEQTEIEESFAEEIAKGVEESDKEQTKKVDKSVKQATELSEQTKQIKQNEINEKTEKDNEDAQKEQANKDATKQAAIDSSIELGNILFGLKTASLQREFEAAAGNEKKQAEISKRLAQHEKKQALFNIGINTAQGIVAALASVPPNVPLSFIIGGIGAIQAGVVAATPIPEFAKGTQYASGGVSLVGEKGREIIQNPKGDISLVNNPALINLERGSKVLTNQQTEAFLNDKNIVNELRQTRKAIQRIPQTTIDRNGNKIAERYKDKKTNYYNSKFRLN